jgi:hypothetical protein
MATKKPSLTRQIGDALGTQDKREQLVQIQQLQQAMRIMPFAVTVLQTAAGVEVSVNAPIDVTASQVKELLNLGVDQITAAMVRAEMQQAEEVAPPEAPTTPQDE